MTHESKVFLLEILETYITELQKTRQFLDFLISQPPEYRIQDIDEEEARKESYDILQTLLQAQQVKQELKR